MTSFYVTLPALILLGSAAFAAADSDWGTGMGCPDPETQNVWIDEDKQIFLCAQYYEARGEKHRAP